MCVYMSAFASTQVVFVCTSTTTCTSKHIYYKVSVLRACLHVRIFLHCLRSLHVRTGQSSTQALCGVDNNLNVSCHNSHGLYWHVYTCHHQLQPKSTSLVYELDVYAHIHQSQIIYGRVRTCQDLCLRPFN